MGKLTDYVEYNGIRERYETGTSRDYDEWMSDDSAGEGFEATMDSFGKVTQAKHDAMERAVAEYDRREANKKARDLLSSRLTALENRPLEQPKAEKKEDAPVELSSTAQSVLQPQEPKQSKSPMDAPQASGQPTQMPVTNDFYKPVTGGEQNAASGDYSLDLSYDPSKGANETSAPLMEGYKDGIMSATAEAGQSTRGRESRMGRFYNPFNNPNGGE